MEEGIPGGHGEGTDFLVGPLYKKLDLTANSGGAV